MRDTPPPAQDTSIPRPGDPIDIHVPGGPRYSGFVEDCVPHLNVVWIRDVRTGERKMLCTDDYQ